MALSGAFSSMLITAQRHWWKGILKLWRHSAVFSLSFDYIPNYGASKQLNQAWMFEQIQMAVELCSTAQLFFFFLPVSVRKETFDERLSWLQGSIVSEWHHHTFLDDSMSSQFVACVFGSARTPREKGCLLEQYRYFLFFFFLWSKHKRQFCLQGCGSLS